MNMYPFASRKYFELFMKDVYGRVVWKRLHARSIEEVASKLRAADIAEWDQICSQQARTMAKKLCCHVELEELWPMTGDSVWRMQNWAISDALRLVTKDRQIRQRVFNAATNTFIDTFDRMRQKRLATPAAQGVNRESDRPETIPPYIGLVSIWDHIDSWKAGRKAWQQIKRGRSLLRRETTEV
jgi:hypothetical protein